MRNEVVQHGPDAQANALNYVSEYSVARAFRAVHVVCLPATMIGNRGAGGR